MAKTYEIAATPHDGFTAYNRAGRRWTSQPTTVTLREGDDAKPEDLEPDEITQKQLDQLMADERIRVYESGSPQARAMRRAAELRGEAAKADAEVAEADAEAARGPGARRSQQHPVREGARRERGATGATGPSGPAKPPEP